MMIRGRTVTVLDPAVERDDYGRPICSSEARDVGNVLLAPPDTSSMSQMGSDVVLVANWPKADPSELAGRLVRVGGEEYAVVGRPMAYDPELTPGDWDRVVYLRRAYEDGGRRGD